MQKQTAMKYNKNSKSNDLKAETKNMSKKETKGMGSKVKPQIRNLVKIKTLDELETLEEKNEELNKPFNPLQ